MQTPETDEVLRGLDELVRAHRPRTKGVRRRLFRELALAIGKRASEDYLFRAGGELWLEDTESLLLFAESRLEAEVLVRVLPPHEREGGTTTVVNTCAPDQPFIVDTLRLCFEQLGHEVLTQINTICSVERARTGRMKSIDSGSDATVRESFTHFEIPAVERARDRKALEDEIRDRIIQIRAMVADFRRILRSLKDQVNQYEFLASLHPGHREEILEARGFLQWITDENFVFMGLSAVGTQGRGEKLRLGLSRLKQDPFEFSYPLARRFVAERDPEKVREFVRVQKTGEESRLHRRGKIDEVLLRTFNDRGDPTGCLVLHGLFTHRAIQARGASVPLLRRKLDGVLAREEATAGSYNYKSIVNAFNALPVEYLFGAAEDDLRRLIRRALVSERSRRREVHLSVNEETRSAFLFVVMPRQNFSDALRVRIQDYLQEVLQANYADHRVLISTHGVAILHFYMTSAEEIPALDEEAVEARVAHLSATWEDRLRDALMAEHDRETAIELYHLYHRAFSARYQVSTEPEQALTDILQLERVRKGEGLQLGLYRDGEDLEQQTMKLRLYHEDQLLLSDIMPILDNFGLRVANSFVNHARFADGRVLSLETFRFELETRDLVEDEELRQDFLEALAAVFSGEMASDALNRVLLPARLSWREVDLLRSYQEYNRQLGNMTTPGSLWPVLVRHAPVVRSIIEYFEIRFGPDGSGRVPSRPSPQRVKQGERALASILEQIDRIESFHDDRILRTLANLVESTLRTSFYRDDRRHPTIAHKLDCARIQLMRDPRPWREIFVHHRNLEGVHLRGGRIARGGLRWSDRPDDFRTEILGLMTTQMVKNVVIVPLGAKGGFVIKRLPLDPAERRAAGDHHYEIFIHALLDLTDDRDGETLVPPEGVVCYDEPDPYLVVAADKGTAHLSDTANRISSERGFWLDDAFASGGSNGYDHKAIGITARGAWVCIRHLLREIGVNPESDPFTCAGIGDMGGDVFGNGLLEHENALLVAAFNHRHIFLDPEPDAKRAYAERRRLFRAADGGWDAYDPAKISEGGGVFDRHAKKIELSAVARRRLGVTRSVMSGSEVVSAILRMPVDLLYNGGIGTYVKATGESQAEAADPSNDAVRIDASELQARVVGEGGNLGLTQAARIEFARNGGRINTDFIDNAGGVNISDHEVNLKILLAPEVASGALKAAARNRLLARIEPEVTGDVLAANSDQALMLSLDERRSHNDLAPFDRVMEEICHDFQVKRGQLDLPTAREMDRRMAEGEPLTRPELATVACFVKMRLYEELLEDEELAMDGLYPALRNYFPAAVRRRFPDAIDRHSLRREIALTRLTNRVLDHTGATFFHEMASEAGGTPRRTFEAYSLLNRAADLWSLKDGIRQLGFEVEVERAYQALLVIESALRQGTRHLLEHWPEEIVAEYLADTEGYAEILQSFEATISGLLDPVSRDGAQQRHEAFVAAGFPPKMAARLSVVRYLPRTLVVLDLAEAAERDPAEVGRDYFAIGRVSGLFGILRWIEEIRPSSYYDALAYRDLRRQLHDLLSELVLMLLERDGSVEERLQAFPAVSRALAEFERIPAEQMGPSALMVMAQEIRQALGA